MSIWTHVAGIVRVDGIGSVTPPIPKFNTWQWEDDDATIDACDVPAGSEGSLYVEIWEAKENSVAKYTVSVFGDLRDYDDEEAIIAFFNKITSKGYAPIGVRGGVFTVKVEGKSGRSFAWVDEEWKEMQAVEEG